MSRRTTRRSAVRSNFEKKDYLKAVGKAKEYIAAGDIFQVVLSQRFEVDLPTAPFEIYRALRIVNPSPYMYFLKMPEADDRRLVAEMLVKIQGREVSYRPIAGTRPRGPTMPKTKSSPRNCWPTKRNAPSTSCWSISAATISDASASTERCESKI